MDTYTISFVTTELASSYSVTGVRTTEYIPVLTVGEPRLVGSSYMIDKMPLMKSKINYLSKNIPGYKIWFIFDFFQLYN